MLEFTVLLKTRGPSGEEIFETAIDPLDVIGEVAANVQGTVWEREEERNARRRKAKEQLDQVPAELPLDAPVELDVPGHDHSAGDRCPIQEVVGVEALADDGALDSKTVSEAIRKYDIDPDRPDPVTL